MEQHAGLCVPVDTGQRGNLESCCSTSMSPVWLRFHCKGKQARAQNYFGIPDSHNFRDRLQYCSPVDFDCKVR